MRRHSTVLVSTAIAVCALLLAAGTTYSRSGPQENIPLKWSPTTTLAEKGAIDVSGA